MQNIANWILAIIQLVVTSLSGLVGYVFKKESSRIKDIEKRLQVLERDVSQNYVKKCDCKPVNNEEILKCLKDLELRISKEFVPKEEYNRAQGELSKKLDRICEILMERK